MIKYQLNLSSMQRCLQDVDEKLKDSIYLRRLEKLNREFNRYITIAKFSRIKPEQSKYKIVAPFLYLKK